jgi:hypothetical protein
VKFQQVIARFDNANFRVVPALDDPLCVDQDFRMSIL